MRLYKPKIEEISYEPKRNNRFYVELPEKYNIPSWSVFSITKPKYDCISNSWKPIKATFLDIVDPKIHKSIYQIYIDYKELNPFDEIDFEFKIIIVNTTGHVIEEWNIIVDTIEFINFGALSHGDDEVSKIKIKFIPKECLLLNE